MSKIFDEREVYADCHLAQREPSVQWRTGFAYDAIGNTVWRSDVGVYAYGGKSRGPHTVTMIGAVPYEYDMDGNLISGRGRTLSYDGGK